MHSNSDSNCPGSDTSLRLRFIVIGGGLAGIGVAIALAQHEHSVVLLEAQETFSEIGAGIQLPPNCTKILDHWGLLDAVRLASTHPRQIDFRSYRDGELLSQTKLVPDVEVQHGGPHLVIHRGQLLALLVDKARQLGVQMHTASLVSHIDFQVPSVKTTDGRCFTADVLIGADGQRSFCRSALLANSGDYRLPPPQKMVYRFTVPSEVMHKHIETSGLVDPPKVTCWMGPSSHVVCYDLDQKGVCNFVLTRRVVVSDTTHIGPRAARLEDLRRMFEDWDPVFRKVLELADMANFWPLQITPEIPRWAHESGKFVLIGDAAHGMTPHLVQGAAQGFEDAAFLGELFSKGVSPRQFGDIMRIFEDVRTDRVRTISKKAEGVCPLWEFEDGPLQQQRDRQLKGMRPFAGYPNPFSDPILTSMLYDYDLFKEAAQVWQRYQKGEWAGTVGSDPTKTEERQEEVRGVKRSIEDVSPGFDVGSPVDGVVSV